MFAVFVKDVLGNASPSLIALVDQVLRRGNVLPRAIFGPEGNFSNGAEIGGAIAVILGIAQGSQLPSAATPLGAHFMTIFVC